MSKPLIRWDLAAQEWVVYVDGESVGAFSRLYEAERFVCGDGDVLIDLDDGLLDGDDAAWDALEDAP